MVRTNYNSNESLILSITQFPSTFSALLLNKNADEVSKIKLFNAYQMKIINIYSILFSDDKEDKQSEGYDKENEVAK